MIPRKTRAKIALWVLKLVALIFGDSLDLIKDSEVDGVDVCQPLPDTEHIEIIEKDGIKVAIEYCVSVKDIEAEQGGVSVSIGLDNMAVSRVH